MKIVLLTGNSSPGSCGVRDYTELLSKAVRSIGLEADLLSVNRWSLADILATNKKLSRIRPDIVHLQYPIRGSGYRLGPQILALKRNTVVTLHEGSQSHILRKLSLYPFALRASHLIFTSEFERQFLSRWAPWIDSISSVIPIGSNISEAQFHGQSRRLNEVVYFGLVMPTKGLEDVLRLALLMKNTSAPLQVRMVGNASPGHESYLEELRYRSRDLPVLWETDLGDEQVASRLASSAVGYLPFPDGASERRASLKAMLLNGMAVVTTRGKHTSRGLEDVVEYSDNPQHALELIRSLLANPSRRTHLGQKGVEYMRQFAWDAIAELHLRVYERVVAEGTYARRFAGPIERADVSSDQNR